ncbi:conserved hypothetical protein [Talaromyces stipitatus ATCC 10500]|uniref:Uncharacterized protein n=1 Tax=Talaromyces stipitatus (strain ATCC 10500 / CBS 375.48 / QM 6759 / NRRL 1006) TaxID=441959 RepID=B8M1X6_TALSN|nr:uncharacterized protein TSTA_085850 [Talaromyces stipitatus ATCC 10500]EED21354.1 conserved hypothetical protein [Talaromyces stipitatus ATCC 10500]
MLSTTLMTFLLWVRRAPSNVQSVELLGSWDNFSRPYPMERDRRMGSGHWRGCHTFTDIIRDGTSPSQSPGRTGGLKMGGTYWYYYRLDGEIEYYNRAEPVTSLCPLLPGQPVNILNVPIILPGTDYLHRRDNSTSSTKSDQRTMDPEDKYMNPRTPPKPRPGLPRLKTSPPFYQQTVPSSSLLNLSNSNEERPLMSQPSSSTHSPKFRLVPRAKAERSVSPPRSRGLRAAFLNIAGARSPGDRVDDRGINHHDPYPADPFVPSTSTSNASSNYSSSLTSPLNSPVELDGVEIGRLPFRHPQVDSEQPLGPPSIRVRRASKSSRENTPLALSLEGHSSSRETGRAELLAFSSTAPLETLDEALSQQATPMAVSPREQTHATAGQLTPVLPNLREKRLPTLPNSPSSVLDAELRAIEARYKPLDMDLLYSHFSDDTSFAASNIYDSPRDPPEKSRFSEWSTDTELVSPASMTSSSTFNVDQLSNSSPFLDQQFQHDTMNHTYNDYTLDAPIPSIAISGPTTPVLGSEAEIAPSPTQVDSAHSRFLMSANSSSAGQLGSTYMREEIEFPSLLIEDFDEFSFHEPDPKRQGAILPLSAVTPLSVGDSSYPSTSPTPKETQFRLSDDYSSQSAAMQELMEEIGYLGEMISSGL